MTMMRANVAALVLSQDYNILGLGLDGGLMNMKKKISCYAHHPPQAQPEPDQVPARFTDPAQTVPTTNHRPV